jgi:tetratricopeptide (TPR) repeat protein
LFEMAVAADARNARGYAGITDTYSLLEAFGVEPARAALPKAHAAASRALELDSSLAEAHTSLSFVLWEEQNRADALREVEEAIQLNPNYATARHWHALYLRDSGRWREAIEEGQRAHALAPESPIIASDLALLLRRAGRSDEARHLLQSLVKQHPGFADAHVQLAEFCRVDGELACAEQHIQQAIAAGDVRASTIARLGWLEAQRGVLLEAFSAVRRLRTMESRGEHVPRQVWVEALCAAGELDLAAEIVADAARNGEQWVVALPGDDLYAALTGSARWRTLEPQVRRIASAMSRQAVETP